MARGDYPDEPGDYSDPTQYANYGGTGGEAYSEYGPPTGYPASSGAPVLPPPTGGYPAGDPPPTPWQQRPAVLIGLGALTAAILALLVYAVVKFTTAGSSPSPAGTTSTAPSATSSPATESPAPSVTTQTAGPAPSTTAAPPPPTTVTTTVTPTTTAAPTTTEAPAPSTTTSVTTSVTTVTETTTRPLFPNWPRPTRPTLLEPPAEGG